MKRRPGAGRKLFGTGYKYGHCSQCVVRSLLVNLLYLDRRKRYVELKGDSLLYYKEKGGKVQG